MPVCRKGRGHGLDARHRPAEVRSSFTAALLVAICACAVAAPCAAQPAARITDIRVHGNHTTPGADILALSGLARGEDASDERLRLAERRLEDSGRFAAVEVRRRLASIEDPSAILVVIVVDEYAAVSDDDLTPGPLDRLASASMWLPILGYADGYGFTYGARVTFVDALGGRSLASVPMTWGGERGIAFEAERTFEGALPIVRAAIGVRRRVNPHFDLADLRTEARVEAERPLAPWLRAGAGMRIAQVSFGDRYDARHAAAGVSATIDTRLDPSFPRNAVHLQVGWEHLWLDRPGARLADPAPSATSARARRWHADLRGYVGVVGSAVLAVRGQVAISSAPLPPAEQALLGGRDSLRGYRAGHRAGDDLAAVSAELRLPVTSPLSVGRFGVKAFVDAGTAWASGERLADQRFDRGAGAGMYFGAGPLLADIDVAWPEQGKPRVHAGLGVSF